MVFIQHKKLQIYYLGRIRTQKYQRILETRNYPPPPPDTIIRKLTRIWYCRVNGFKQSFEFSIVHLGHL